jgi:hypothetical protein
VKNKEEIEIPESYYERHPLILTISILLSAILMGSSLYLFIYKDFEFHGWALILMPPGLYATLQTLVFILNPYALIFKDRMEIKKHFFSNKVWYFNDIKKVSDVGKDSFAVIYNDDEQEKISLKGIKPSHLKPLRDELQRNIQNYLDKRVA